MRDLKWSPVEEIIARRVFERALNEELREVILAAKRMAAAIEEAPALWELESWLTDRRQEIDRK